MQLTIPSVRLHCQLLINIRTPSDHIDVLLFTRVIPKVQNDSTLVNSKDLFGDQKPTVQLHNV